MDHIEKPKKGIHYPEHELQNRRNFKVCLYGTNGFTSRNQNGSISDCILLHPLLISMHPQCCLKEAIAKMELTYKDFLWSYNNCRWKILLSPIREYMRTKETGISQPENFFFFGGKKS